MRVTAIALALSAFTAAQSAPSLFVTAPPLRVGQGSGTILLADVNGDARTDLLTHHSLRRLVTVHLGREGGGFIAAAGSPIGLPYHSGGAVLGDLNGDGRPDLVITAGEEDIVDVLLGAGTGSFRRVPGSPFTVTTETLPFNKRTVRLEDINEDGHLDVVTANGRRRNSFEVMLGDGRGGLSRGPSVKLDSGCDGYVFALGDVNGDRHLDAVNACAVLGAPPSPARLSVLLGDGSGAFAPAPGSPFEVPGGVRSVVLADVDADGRPEIVMMQAQGLVTMLTNQGGGRFAAAAAPPANVGGDAWNLRVEDLNGDGKPDLVAAAVDRVVVLLAGASGYAPAAGSPFKAGPGAYNAVVGDVNADGRPDIAASSFAGDTLTLLVSR